MRAPACFTIVALAALGGAGDAPRPKAFSLKPGEFYFRVDGTQSFLVGRNPTGWKIEQFDPLLRWAAEAGESLVRIHLTHGRPHKAPPGEIDEAWAKRAEGLFDLAEERGLHVLPVFGVWAEWNDGSRGETWHTWDKNPYNAANGGPTKRPADLLDDTETRKLWLRWLGAVVARWQRRPNILGWEAFSEIDLVTGAREAAGVAFVERAAATICAADPRKRPITASLAGINDWPSLSRSKAIDFIQIHPYADHGRYRGNLDLLILDTVRQRLRRYGLPVFIGESGLTSRPPHNTLATAPRAEIGIRHAIWATAVSGAMNGRMLWWEDGYDQYGRLDLRTRVKHAAAPVARFVRGIDFAGLKPIEAKPSAQLKGAALGRADLILGWFRDAGCEPPEWPVRNLADQAVVLAATSGPWRVAFHASGSGKLDRSHVVRSEAGSLTIALPPFEGSIAFTAARQR